VARVGRAEAAARDEADRRLDDGVEATVKREATRGLALALALLVPDRLRRSGKWRSGKALASGTATAPRATAALSAGFENSAMPLDSRPSTWTAPDRQAGAIELRTVRGSGGGLSSITGPSLPA
jgi:hypothetical protein